MADENIELLLSILKDARVLLQGKGLDAALSKIAGDYYEKLFAQYYLFPWNAEDVRSNLILTAYYLQIVGTKLLAKEEYTEESQKILRYAAQIFEYVARFLTDKRVDKINELEIAAICYDCSGYPANCIVLAENAINEFTHKHDEIGKNWSRSQFLNQTRLLVLRLLSRDYNQIGDSSKVIVNECPDIEKKIRTIKRMSTKKRAIIDYLGTREVIFSITCFNDFALNGNEEAYKKSIEALTRSLSIAFNVDDAENYALRSLLLIVLQKIHDRSVWAVLPKHMKNVEPYLRLLASSKTPIVELWESQLQAIEKGLLVKSKRSVISMPTSAGKTLIAELAIVDSLTRNLESTCIYITPSRALAQQVEEDLRNRLPSLGYKVSRLTGSYDCQEIEELKLKNCRVLVTTPEKLNLLIKKSLPVFDNCQLFVFDEAQSLQGEDRGIHLEMLLIRIRHLLPDRKFLLLSAVMKNAEQVANWIGNNHANTINVEWHPTRILQAIYFNGEIKYYGSLKSLNIPIPHSKTNTIAGRVIDVAKAYRKIGSILIFCNSKGVAEQTAEKVYDENVLGNSQEVTPGLRTLADQVEIEFGNDFPLSKYVLKGIAYHHADLPAEVKSGIEKLVKTGEIRIVASTTTLAEGINTPVNTVIMPYFKFRDYSPYGAKGFRGSQWTPLTKSLYRNIAGRAGRALRNTEGHVVIIKPTDMDMQSVEDYIVSGREQLEPIKSALTKVALQKKLNLEDKSALAFQTEVLASICDNVFIADNPENLINLTFFGYSEDKSSVSYNQLKEHVISQMRHLEKKLY